MSGEIADKLDAINELRKRIDEHQDLARAALAESQRHTDEAQRLQGEAQLLMRDLTGEASH